MLEKSTKHLLHCELTEQNEKVHFYKKKVHSNQNILEYFERLIFTYASRILHHACDTCVMIIKKHEK